LSARALRLISAVAGGFTRFSAAESSMLMTGVRFAWASV
jgi:hypothetical protein